MYPTVAPSSPGSRQAASRALVGALIALPGAIKDLLRAPGEFDARDEAVVNVACPAAGSALIGACVAMFTTGPEPSS
jgi:hypothetical protein